MPDDRQSFPAAHAPATPTLEGSARFAGAAISGQAHTAGCLLAQDEEAMKLRTQEIGEKYYGFFHEVSRFFTFFRTDQARNYAILRIFTGEALFWAKLGT